MQVLSQEESSRYYSTHTALVLFRGLFPVDTVNDRWRLYSSLVAYNSHVNHPGWNEFIWREDAEEERRMRALLLNTLTLLGD